MYAHCLICEIVFNGYLWIVGEIVKVTLILNGASFDDVNLVGPEVNLQKYKIVATCFISLWM